MSQQATQTTSAIGSGNVSVDAQALIDALKEQRNQALDQVAIAVARNVMLVAENHALKEQLKEKASCPD